jgi:hypothetical protein
MSNTNALAYFAAMSLMITKVFVKLLPRACIIKIFMTIIFAIS